MKEDKKIQMKKFYKELREGVQNEEEAANSLWEVKLFEQEYKHKQSLKEIKSK